MRFSGNSTQSMGHFRNRAHNLPFTGGTSHGEVLKKVHPYRRTFPAPAQPYKPTFRPFS
jgi:hypothetical protein